MYTFKIYTNSTPTTETSQSTIAVFGQVEGSVDNQTHQNIVASINDSYPTDSQFQYKVFDADGNEVGSSAITDYSASSINVGDIDITVAEAAYVCPANSTTEASFADTYVSGNYTDIDESESVYTEWTVAQIAAVFNTARAGDPTVTTDLQMPTQTEWDAMSESEKALYLINSERCARGIIVYEGIEPTVITSPAQTYADYIVDNRDSYVNPNSPHELDGRTPWERLTEDALVDVGTNADFFQYAENIAMQAVGSSQATPTLYQTTARSVYAWMYKDQGSSYGHRNFLLATGLTENSGESSMEGLIGLGQATYAYEDGGFYWRKTHTVLNAFDPNGAWDLSNIIQVDIQE